MKKDDKRPLSEPSTSSLLYAPHAANSDVGIAHANWTPEPKPTSLGKINFASSSCTLLFSFEEDMTFENSKKSDEDNDVNARIRGESKLGGAITAFETKASESRSRKPIKASISSGMDFRRQRNIKTLTERIEEIHHLREEIAAAKQNLLLNETASSQQAKLQVIRSALSNQTSIAKAVLEANAIKGLNQNLEKYNYSKAADKDQLIGKFMKSASTNKVSLSTNEFLSSPTTIEASPLVMPEKIFSATSTPKTGRLKKDLSTSSEMERKRALSVSFLDNDNSSNNSDKERRQRTKEQELEYDDDKDEEANLLIEMAKSELEKEFQELLIDESASNRRLHYHVHDQKISDQLKTKERITRTHERSRNIERKRRLLTEEEGKRVGPQPEEELNVYDYYAIRVQSLIRGWLARCWVRWYRANATKACIVIQSALRGWFARMRVRKMKKETKAAIIIQKNFRGWNERVSFSFSSAGSKIDLLTFY